VQCQSQRRPFGRSKAGYAFFPEKRRLLVEQSGKLTTYDSGDHRISGVSQQQSQGQSLAFTDQNGLVKLDDLKRCWRSTTAIPARTWPGSTP
jgi:hypothetical protein